jgi:hypothetical protein
VVKYSIEGLHKLVTHHPLRLPKARAHLHITWVKHKFTVSVTLIPHVSFTGHNEWFTCLIILVCHDSQFERWQAVVIFASTVRRLHLSARLLPFTRLARDAIVL